MEDYEVRAYSPYLFPPPSPFFLFLFFLPLFFSRFTVGFPQDPPSVPSTPQLRRKNCNLRADFVSIPIITGLVGPESSEDSMWASSIHQITFAWKKDCSSRIEEEREFVELRSIILKLGNSRASRRRYEGRGTFPSRFDHFLASKTNAISRRTRLFAISNRRESTFCERRYFICASTGRRKMGRVRKIKMRFQVQWPSIIGTLFLVFFVRTSNEPSRRDSDIHGPPLSLDGSVLSLSLPLSLISRALIPPLPR